MYVHMYVSIYLFQLINIYLSIYLILPYFLILKCLQNNCCIAVIEFKKISFNNRRTVFSIPLQDGNWNVTAAFTLEWHPFHLFIPLQQRYFKLGDHSSEHCIYVKSCIFVSFYIHCWYWWLHNFIMILIGIEIVWFLRENLWFLGGDIRLSNMNWKSLLIINNNWILYIIE